MASRAEAIAETALQLIFHADNLTASKISDIASGVQRLTNSIETGVTRVKTFKFDVRWKTRVISVPKAIENFRRLLESLTTGLRSKLHDIARPFESFKAGLKLSSSLPADPGVSRISTAFTELELFISNLNLLVGDLATAIDSAADLTDLFDELINDIETLDTVFLQQTNKRKLESKESKIRVGKLHSSA